MTRARKHCQEHATHPHAAGMRGGEDSLTPDECELLGQLLFAAYHFGARTAGGVDRELDATIGRLMDSCAAFKAKGHANQASSYQARIDALVTLRDKLARRRARLAS